MTQVTDRQVHEDVQRSSAFAAVIAEWDLEAAGLAMARMDTEDLRALAVDLAVGLVKAEARRLVERGLADDDLAAWRLVRDVYRRIAAAVADDLQAMDEDQR